MDFEPIIELIFSHMSTFDSREDNLIFTKWTNIKINLHVGHKYGKKNRQIGKQNTNTNSLSSNGFPLQFFTICMWV